MGRLAKAADPVVLDQQLAAALRRFREHAEIKGDDLAELLGWSPSKVSRIERGRHGINRRDLTAWLRYCEVPTEEAQPVFALYGTAAAGLFVIPGGHFGSAGRATSVLDWSALVVPWLLQTPAYTRALLESRQPAARWAPITVTEFIDAVGSWQTRLQGQTSLRAVIDEAVLYRQVGSEVVMRKQLSVLDRAGADPGQNIQVRVLPLASGGLVGYPPFTYMEYAGTADLAGAPEVLAWQLGGSRSVGLEGSMASADADAWLHKVTFTQIWEYAESPAPMIKKALTEAWGGE
jgi:transcriptional regulator with XRE-family HTH domain